jgi:hypothetical protein
MLGFQPVDGWPVFRLSVPATNHNPPRRTLMPPSSKAEQRRTVDERADADPREQRQPHPARE